MSEQGNRETNQPIGIKIELNYTEKRVVVEFNQPVELMNFTPHQAVAFAEAVLKKAMELADAQNIILPSNMN